MAVPRLANTPADCSSSIWISVRLRLAIRVWKNSNGIAVTRPMTVVTRAWEIPPAISFGSPVPNRLMDWKVAIMPVTVPSSPEQWCDRGQQFDQAKTALQGWCFSQNGFVKQRLHGFDVPVFAFTCRQ